MNKDFIIPALISFSEICIFVYLIFWFKKIKMMVCELGCKIYLFICPVAAVIQPIIEGGSWLTITRMVGLLAVGYAASLSFGLLLCVELELINNEINKLNTLK